MIRILLALALSLVLPLTLVACGGGRSNDTGAMVSSPVSSRASMGAASTMNGSSAGGAAMMNNGPSFAQKHKKALSVAAGIAAYQAAKRTGANREAAGGNKNFMQRHPVITGIGAAMLTHHMLSRHRH